MADGTCTAVAIGLTNLADVPLLAHEAGAALVGTGLDQTAIAEAARRARAIAQPAADGRGPVEFRVHVAGIMVGRAIARAKERAGRSGR
jgi:carbon-monoxide dehydrogenase medium subunit